MHEGSTTYPIVMDINLKCGKNIKIIDLPGQEQNRSNENKIRSGKINNLFTAIGNYFRMIFTGQPESAFQPRTLYKYFKKNNLINSRKIFIVTLTEAVKTETKDGNNIDNFNNNFSSCEYVSLNHEVIEKPKKVK